jgi:hypothetical protein
MAYMRTDVRCGERNFGRNANGAAFIKICSVVTVGGHHADGEAYYGYARYGYSLPHQV